VPYKYNKIYRAHAQGDPLRVNLEWRDQKGKIHVRRKMPIQRFLEFVEKLRLRGYETADRWDILVPCNNDPNQSNPKNGH